MSPMTPALIDYWHRLPAESPVVRRKTLDTICDRVRAGLEPRSALVPFALGDVDDGIVAAATQAYVGAAPGPVDADALHEAAEWVRRGLALHRGAVFGALLALGDAVVHERLAALRLSLSAEEVAVVCRRLPPAPAKSILQFLHQWAELLEGSDEPTQRRQFDVVAGALHGHSEVMAQRVAA